jgi:hypothetical protein
LLLLGAPGSPFFSVVLFSAVAIGAYGFLPVFFSVPGEFLTGFSAAAGIALVTSVANLGGFVGLYTVGLIQQKTGNSYSGLICAEFFVLSQRAGIGVAEASRVCSGSISSAVGVIFEKGT